jgi:hypothetical protein
MPNDAYSEAIKEAYASAPTDIVVIDTLEISHPALPGGSMWLSKTMVDYTLTLEDGVTNQLFSATGFEFKLPAAGENGLQELNIVIDNVDRRVSEFMNAVKDSKYPVKLTYRPYLSTDLTAPQLDPPLVLNVTDVKADVFKVTARATFADLLNKKHPLQMYTRARFPSLGGS